MQQGSGEHLEHCAEDQTRGRRTQAVKAVLDQRRVAELIERTRHQNDDDDRRQYERAGRCDGTGNAGCVEACVCCRVDTERAGRGFGHRDHVHQVAWCEPRVAQRDLLEERQGRQSAADGEQTVPEQAALQLEHVTFGYEKDRTILQDVSLTIPQGSFVSLVGESGCGKSTIAALLSGSRTGYTGSVTLGGVPVEQLQRAQRLRALTLVPHNATIFKGTVEANLRMAKPDATEAELWAALEQVNLADFCRSQDGLQTALHEGGSNLSGGQRQRLAMARALLHDTPIYLFDEATSNVDAESENDIMAAIRSLAGRKTVILISHRLANVVDSDCIYVLDKGRIAERGTHAELLKKQGAYSRLYTAQKQLETLETEDA